MIDPPSSATPLHGVSSSHLEERTLDDSHHVATLDHAERIFAESDEFIARVAAPSPGDASG